MKFTHFTAITLLSLCLQAPAQAALINIAPTGTATASNFWKTPTGLYDPQNAIDGNNSTTWNSGGFRQQWIEIDLGSIVAIDSITGLTEQTPEGFVRHNVYLDGLLNYTWNEFSTTEQLFTHDFISPILAQTIRIETSASPSWVAWREIEIFSESSAVPLPPTSLLFLTGLAGFLVFRNRKAN